MVSYKPYSSYRRSRVEWLGDIPANWGETKLKFIGDLILGLTYSPNDVVGESDGGTLVLRSSNVQGGKIELNDCVYVSSSIPKKLITTERDILICSRNGSRALIGKCAVIDEHVSGQTFGAFMTVFRTQYTKFVYYILNSSLFKFQSGRFLTSTINQLTTETLGGFEIPLPPLDEQQTIARFLDFKTAQIDTLIAKKQTLLEKLAEKRTALISHAVTKGLDPTVPVKDSGVTWLGEVPAHWKVIPIKFSLAMPITDGPHSTPQFYNDGIPFLSAESVKKDRLDFSRMRGYISEDDHAFFSKKYKPRLGDVYMVKSGATTGAVARVETHDEFNIWSPLAVLRPHPDKSVTNYLFYVLKSKPFFYSVELSWSYGTQQNIGMGVISNIRMALPPLKEQEQICRYLEPLLQKIEEQKSKVDSVIDRLQEYRSSLITNAVTGKIDVRDFPIPRSTAEEVSHA